MSDPLAASTTVAPPGRTVARPLSACPDLLALHAADPARYFCLLQSGALAPRTGRYDILFAHPRRIGSARGRTEALSLLRQIDAIPAGGVSTAGSTARSTEPELPFVGGFVFHLGYEAARCFEPALELPHPGMPALGDVAVWQVPAAIIHDRATSRAWCVADDAGLCAELERDARRPLPAVRAHDSGVRAVRVQPPQRFTDGVAAVLEYLRAGDAFQVNLSRAWQLRLPAAASPAELQAAMLRHNAAPFAALLHDADATLLSASPERLARVSGGMIETRPIAGTRPRGATPEADRALCEELRANAKERAEHIMLIDLERNDLGRICVPGSVRVDELLALEHYASVHHLVSNVSGQLQPGTRWSDVLRAVFPGGTITGCPKFRVMQIIAALEGEGRGSYTGTLGYVSAHGAMDSNILIRSMTMQGDRAWFRAGAGIVADSRPDAELAETESKALGLLRGLGA